MGVVHQAPELGPWSRACSTQHVCGCSPILRKRQDWADVMTSTVELGSRKHSDPVKLEQEVR